MAKAWDLSDEARDAIRIFEGADETLAALLVIRGLASSLFREGEQGFIQEHLDKLMGGKRGLLELRDLVERIAQPDYV